MKHDPKVIKGTLEWVIEQMADLHKKGPKHREWVAANTQDFTTDALAYIRQLEGDLRRAGFTEYNDPKETEE